MTEVWLPVLAGVLLVVTSWLAAVETVVERLSLVRALRLADEDRAGSLDLLWSLEHRTTSRNAVLVATVFTRVGFAAAVTLVAVDLDGPALAAVILAAGALAVVVGEVAPRTLTLRRLEDVGCALGSSVRGLVRVVDPLARLLVNLGRRLVATRRDVAGPYPSDEELAQLLSEADEDDPIEDDERAMISSILELGDTIVREIMVPRPDMVTVTVDDELRDVIETVIEHGRSRIPVVRDNGERVVGVVHAKDVLARLATRPGSGRWSDLVRAAHFVPESKRVDRLLAEMRDDAVHQAIVVDEYGAVTGLVTIEDVLEEIVGEIVDEHDDELPLVEVLASGEMRVDARLPVSDLDELMDVELPDDGWDTVGGLVFGMLGRVPQVGDEVGLDGIRFIIEQVQGRRVEQVLVRRDEVHEETA